MLLDLQSIKFRFIYFILLINIILFVSNDLWGQADQATSSVVGYSPIGNICTSNRYSIAEGNYNHIT